MGPAEIIVTLTFWGAFFFVVAKFVFDLWRA